MAPGYVVRKPLGAVGDAGSLPYALTTVHAACSEALRRGAEAWARHCGMRRRGATDRKRKREAGAGRGASSGIGARSSTARTTTASATGRAFTALTCASANELPPMPHAAPSRQCLQRALFGAFGLFVFRGAHGAVVSGRGKLPGGKPETIMDRT